MHKPGNRKATVKVYHGYGHTNDLVVYGHAFAKAPATRLYYTDNVLLNMIHLLKLFFIKPLAHVNVQLQWRNQLLQSSTEKDGFFKFEWKSEEEVSAGWHLVTIRLLDEQGNVATAAEGKIYVPHSTQYAFISDIDDTVLVSHSATIGKRLRVLFANNPRTRNAFADVVQHYELLASAHTNPETPNPFFYVSSSEWNLYDDLNDFFNFNNLPKGVFLLNQIKKWYQFFRTGKTNHQGKLFKVYRIFASFPKQRFVLLGDNSQSDPEIYSSIATRYPEKIFAVYIRSVNEKKEHVTRELLTSMEKKGIHTCLFKDNKEAILHSRMIGLI